MGALRDRLIGAVLETFTVRSVSLLRTYDPPHSSAVGRSVVGVERLAKRLVFEFDDELFMVLHLMKLGRLRWADPGKKPKNAAGKVHHATLVFDRGTLVIVEMGPKKRASVHMVQGRAGLAEHDRGGAEVGTLDLEGFKTALTERNHTLKRALTDPRYLSGIGNAYSDEILHAAQLSPVKQTQKLSPEEWERLFEATTSTLEVWTERLREQVGDGFPEKVTAFRPEMAVHGKYGKPCPVCGEAVQRIVYSARETNYCAVCQTGGKPLADRALSRLLGKDWPKTLEELEERRNPKA